MLPYLSRSVSLLTLSLLLSPLSDFQANARWATADEASIECLEEKNVYKVKKDGSWVFESEVWLKPLNETGRQALSSKTYTYEAIASTFEVLEAKTITDGKEFIVPKDKIEDKLLASDARVLSERHQVLIPFERLSVGSIVHIKTQQELKTPQYENYFAKTPFFGDDCFWKNYELMIESEIPLFYKLNDPRDSFRVSESKTESKHTLQFKLQKSLFETRVDEPDHSHQDFENYTSLDISTEKGYERLGRIGASFYQLNLKESLPEKLENIRSRASIITDEVKCIDTVVTHLMDHMHYLSHGNTLMGKLVPRSLEKIITSGQADCKEYSACLAAILNSLGYQARIAVIQRRNVYRNGGTLPNASQFNHAIVKVTAPSGKIYWVDPTNNVSMVDGIFSDIADRPVLVLDPENPTYEHTPPVDYNHAVLSYDRTITFSENGAIKIEGTWDVTGEAAQYVVSDLLMNSLSSVKNDVVKQVSVNGNPINGTLTFTEEKNTSQYENEVHERDDYPEKNTAHERKKSRTVRPLHATFSCEEKHVMMHTNFGNVFPLSGCWLYRYTTVPEDNEGALYVGDTETILEKTFFKNVSAQHLDKLAYSIETPWLNAKRELTPSDGGILITEKLRD